jgi:hypothetical protein
MSEMREMPEIWHVEKSIPLALILSFCGAIFIQTAGALWWAATISARVGTVETIVALIVPNQERLTRVETKLDSVDETVKSIQGYLRALPVAQPQPTPRR